MEPEFPLEFIVYGTPVSLQRRRTRAREEWKQLVVAAAEPRLPEMNFATSRPLAITLYYFPDGPMDGDIDNIVKLTVDALCGPIMIDDSQVERIVVQKFEPGGFIPFRSPTATLSECIVGEKPALYVRISDDPYEELRG